VDTHVFILIPIGVECSSRSTWIKPPARWYYSRYHSKRFDERASLRRPPSASGKFWPSMEWGHAIPIRDSTYIVCVFDRLIASPKDVSHPAVGQWPDRDRSIHVSIRWQRITIGDTSLVCTDQQTGSDCRFCGGFWTGDPTAFVNVLQRSRADGRGV
jgi:hypothetical protein